MPRFLPWLCSGLLALALPAAAESDLSGPVKVDEFNPDVARKDGSENHPVRGGTLRVRVPGDPKSLNPMNDNDAPTQQVYQYLSNDLVERDRETFEWLPMLARWFEVQDTVELTSGERLIGRIVSEEDDGSVVFAPGVSRVTVGEHDLERFEPAGGGAPFAFGQGKPFPEGVGRIVPREGTGIPPFEGRIARPPGGRYTVWIERRPSETRRIAQKDIAYVLEGDEGAKESVPALRREVAFVFHLRHGVRWHDRQPFSADDVVFSFDTFMNPAVDAAQMRQSFEDLERYEKVDDHTVRFLFKRQYFGAFSACAGALVYPRHRFQPDQFQDAPEEFGKHFNEHPDHSGPVGLGPYKFSRWDRGKMLEVVRNEDWWVTPKGPDGKRHSLVPWIDPDRPYLDRIRWIIINNKAAALKALQNGEVDADFDVEPSTWVDPDTNTPEFTAHFVRAKFLQPLYTYIGWNEDRKGVGPERQFFRDRRVRTAMTLLIPREKILREIHHGLGEIVTGPFFKYGPYCDPEVPVLPYNPRRAKLLLDAAGWIDHDGDGIRDRDGVPFEFDYVIHNMRDYHQKIADIIKESVEQAGVRMNIRKLDWAVFVDTVQDQQFDAVRFAWGEPNCVETDPFQIWHSSQASGRGSNYISFRNPIADRIIMENRRELSLPRRQRLLRRLHRLLHREQPYTFLFNFYSLYFYARKFRNVRFTIIGTDPYRWDEWFIPRELQDR
ncbi:MAG: hypothetical protein D6731_24400 [Planctomycetota bacterium]|nr:MAG: hypothetical protein D6731_24400 [Planctomycetota bacterium]